MAGASVAQIAAAAATGDEAMLITGPQSLPVGTAGDAEAAI
jgi:hypothetical protein